MNPYEAPKTEAKKVEAVGDGPSATDFTIRAVLAAAAGVGVRWLLEIFGLGVIAGWSAALIGLGVGAVLAPAPAAHGGRTWPVTAFVVTAVGLAIGAFLPITFGGRFFSIWGHAAALSLAVGPVAARQRAMEARESMRARDDEQRALFARTEAAPPPPPKPSTARLRLACKDCGELAYEDELSPERLCEACA